MTDRIGQPQQQPSPGTQPDTVTFYWLATIQTDDGHRITCDGTMTAVPGTHTRLSTTRALLADLKERHGGLTVLCLYLEQNDISALPRPVAGQ
ncbi:hypothetical protein TR631_33765 [Streptomyces rochei]|uniref:hypothetical protein n=1 Tax=Streptomyces rochei TaxID=1928 RepID=UPI002ACD69C5|nr:hypothetical protein [Streptomyces rochei]WQC16531.1 hypothetical protein TR631_33765 [Streptomyces rochei]